MTNIHYAVYEKLLENPAQKWNNLSCLVIHTHQSLRDGWRTWLNKNFYSHNTDEQEKETLPKDQEDAVDKVMNRSWRTDLTLWFFTLTAFLYALGCGLTVAGGLIALLGAGTYLTPIALFFGAVGFWVNWRNSRSRIPELIEEIFMQSTQQEGMRWYHRIMPGLQFYEEKNQVKAFSKKQIAGNVFGLLCSIAVGASIGAITWSYTASLMVTLGFAAGNALIPMIASIVAVTIICELALQLKSFIDMIREDKIPARWRQLYEKINTLTPTRRALLYFFGLTIFGICTAALYFLTIEVMEGLKWVIGNPLGLAHTFASEVVVIVVGILHFIGTMPYNIDMVMNCLCLAMSNSGEQTSHSWKEKVSNTFNKVKSFFVTHRQSFGVGWLIGFCGYTMLASLPIAATPAVAITLLCLTGAAIGIATGLIACLLQERLFPRIINAIGNGIVVQHEGIGSIIINAGMSFVSSYADVDDNEFKKVCETQASHDEGQGQALSTNTI